MQNPQHTCARPLTAAGRMQQQVEQSRKGGLCICEQQHHQSCTMLHVQLQTPS
jgi:hypothetical protein